MAYPLSGKVYGVFTLNGINLVRDYSGEVFVSATDERVIKMSGAGVWFDEIAPLVIGGYLIHSKIKDAWVTLDFKGTNLCIGFLGDTNRGIARVFIDGIDKGTVDLYRTEPTLFFTHYTNLDPRVPHRVEVIVTGDKNPSSTDTIITILGFSFDFTPLWVLPLADRTISGVGSSFDVSGLREGILWLNVTSVAGVNPTLVVHLEGSPDGLDWDYPPLYSFASVSGIGKWRLFVTNFGKYIRINFVIGGTTPSFRFQVVFTGK